MEEKFSSVTPVTAQNSLSEGKEVKTRILLHSQHSSKARGDKSEPSSAENPSLVCSQSNQSLVESSLPMAGGWKQKFEVPSNPKHSLISQCKV